MEALRGVKNLANCIVDEIEVVGILDGSYVRDLTLLEYEAMDAVLLVACKAEKILAVHSLKGSMCV